MGIKVEVELELAEFTVDRLEALQAAIAEELCRRQPAVLLVEGAWEVEMLQRVLRQLRGTPQERAIVEAAHDPEGRISRAQVMEILGRDEARRLTGFTKPIKRAVDRLRTVSPELIPAQPFPFWADYAGGTTALGFAVGRSALPAMRAAVGI